MKAIRRIEIVTCSICGAEHDKLTSYEMFTGRKQHICPRCYSLGNEELKAKREAWRDSAKGKQAIERARKNK